MNQVRSLLLFLLILCSASVHAIESLSFNQLSQLDNYDPEMVRNTLVDYIDQEVQIRGFIYQNGDGRFVLSSRPTIATCCQKKQENLPHQIYLVGDLLSSSNGRTVSVQGIFSLAPIRDREGNLTELYALKWPKITHIESNATWVFFGAALGAILLLAYWRRSRKC